MRGITRGMTGKADTVSLKRERLVKSKRFGKQERKACHHGDKRFKTRSSGTVRQGLLHCGCLDVYCRWHRSPGPKRPTSRQGGERRSSNIKHDFGTVRRSPCPFPSKHLHLKTFFCIVILKRMKRDIAHVGQRGALPGRHPAKR